MQSQQAAAGTNVTFSVAALGSGLSFQWSFNGTAIAGATSSSLTLSKVAAANAGSYTVTVTNSAGSITSSAAVLSIITPPASSNYANAYGITTLAGTAGSFGSTVGTGAAARFASPIGTAVDASGNVYVADGSNGTILKITSAGVVTTLAGTAGAFGSANGTGAAAQFLFPFGIAVDASGNVYVSDYGASTIRKITSAGVVTTLAGTAGVIGSADGTGAAVQFYNPAGIAVDASGNIYVADSFNDVVRKITSAGVSSTLAGTAARLRQRQRHGRRGAVQPLPDSVARVDASGNVYVADGFNSTIRKITSAGVSSTLAGTAGVTGSADGTGAAAQFNLPEGVAVDSAGSVYVSDSGNDTIRKVTSVGVVTTLAGVAGSRRQFRWVRFHGPVQHPLRPCRGQRLQYLRGGLRQQKDGAQGLGGGGAPGHHRPAPGCLRDGGIALLPECDRHGRRHADLSVVAGRCRDLRGHEFDLLGRGRRDRQCGIVHRDRLQ